MPKFHEISEASARYLAHIMVKEGTTLDNEIDDYSFLMKKKIQEILAKTAGLSLPKEEPLPEYLNESDFRQQYDSRIKELIYFGLLNKDGLTKDDNVAPPELEKVVESFSPAEIEIAKTYQLPVLLLIPETSFSALINAIYTHPLKKKIETKIDRLFYYHDKESDKITGWRVAIVEGTRILSGYEGDLQYSENFALVKNRIVKRKKDRLPGERGMNRQKYALLAMESLLTGKPIDNIGATILDDDPLLSNSFIPYAKLENSDPDAIRLYLSRETCDCDDGALFRSTVGGDKLIG